MATIHSPLENILAGCWLLNDYTWYTQQSLAQMTATGPIDCQALGVFFQISESTIDP